ncbi:hypothetical protein DL95DRAFT_499357 [Leptodontidium sp. 2 PMI_412]|nr:hypothetical protein DL95DRAFT_499357 [Leptodontidium sp. 2 PMI_412]
MHSKNWRIKHVDPEKTPATPATDNRRDSIQSRSPLDKGQQSSPMQNKSSMSGGHRKPIGGLQAPQCVEKCRRLWIGGLSSDASRKDIERLFQGIESVIEGIEITVDATTGRNPSYCFVDFKYRELAEAVMQKYNGQRFLHWTLDVKLQEVQSERYNSNSMSRSENSSIEIRLALHQLDRLEKSAALPIAAEEGRQLYVGGLPVFESQEKADLQMMELFSIFEVEVFGRQISAYESKLNVKGNHNYCFVQLASPGEAAVAATFLNQQTKWDGIIKATVASSTPSNAYDRRLYVGGLPKFPDFNSTVKNIEEVFQGFQIFTISTLKVPKDQGGGAKKSCFCFVTLVNESDVDRALSELDGKQKWDGEVRVQKYRSLGHRGRKAESREPTSDF